MVLAGHAVSGQAPVKSAVANDQVTQRIYGMLLGSAIGDAAGGPVEFQERDKARRVLPDCRSWPAKRSITADDLRQLSASLNLLDYAEFRPTAEPYGQWKDSAPAGTVTDDTRWKIVTLAAIRRASESSDAPLTAALLAHCFLKAAELPELSRPEYAKLLTESFFEFQLAARTLVTADDANVSPCDASERLPLGRIWGGLPTCCGQMITTPIAGLYPGRPEEAYRAAYRLSFFDQGTAKDTNAAITAGLAAMLVEQEGSLPRRFAKLRRVMIETDPYRYADVPFIERPIARWIQLAEQCVAKANGSPSSLYDQLISAFHPQYFWEARFTFGSAWALLVFCEWDGLAAMHLAMDMGHDTDSVAQLIGLFAGAVSGPELFPDRLRVPVESRLREDYGVSLTEWAQLLKAVPAGKN